MRPQFESHVLDRYRKAALELELHIKAGSEGRQTGRPDRLAHVPAHVFFNAATARRAVSEQKRAAHSKVVQMVLAS